MTSGLLTPSSYCYHSIHNSPQNLSWHMGMPHTHQACPTLPGIWACLTHPGTLPTTWLQVARVRAAEASRAPRRLQPPLQSPRRSTGRPLLSQIPRLLLPLLPPHSALLSRPLHPPVGRRCGWLLRAWGLGFRVWGCSQPLSPWTMLHAVGRGVPGFLRFGVWGSGFREQGLGVVALLVQGSGFWGSGFRIREQVLGLVLLFLLCRF